MCEVVEVEVFATLPPLIKALVIGQVEIHLLGIPISDQRIAVQNAV